VTDSDEPTRDAVLDLWGTVSDHLGTLRSYRTEKVRLAWIALFFGLPAGGSALLWFTHAELRPVSSIVVTALAVLAGLLFNLLLLIYEAASRARDENAPGDTLRFPLLRDTNKNVAFAVLVSIVAAAGGVWTGIAHGTVQRIVGTGTIYFLGVFVLTLLMILRRVRVLINQELRRRPPGRARDAA
jgi:hypothetical protein